MVLSEEEEAALLLYETEKYEVVRCEIGMDQLSREAVTGRTFRFAADEEETV